MKRYRSTILLMTIFVGIIVSSMAAITIKFNPDYKDFFSILASVTTTISLASIVITQAISIGSTRVQVAALTTQRRAIASQVSAYTIQRKQNELTAFLDVVNRAESVLDQISEQIVDSMGISPRVPFNVVLDTADLSNELLDHLKEPSGVLVRANVDAYLEKYSALLRVTSSIVGSPDLISLYLHGTRHARMYSLLRALKEKADSM